MSKFKKILCIFFACLITASFVSCSSQTTDDTSGDDKLNIVVTIFPQYDFIRAIAGDKVNLTMLLSPGAESHNYEASLADISTIKNSDLFIYVGGESDEWVDDILETIDESSQMQPIALVDLVTTVQESDEGIIVEEAEEDESEEEEEIDEHVWTSLKNAQTIITSLADTLCQLDSENAEYYQTNAEEYNDKLSSLDSEYQQMVANASKDTVVIADRFPFRYLFDDYSIKAVAAFSGCSSNQEITLETQSKIINAINENNLDVVFTIELNNNTYADAICDATGATHLVLNSCHNLSQDDFDSGITYYDLMAQNLEVLSEALN